MTTETDLLPLPDWMECLGEVSAADIRDYARANVAHAVAPLQAEIEALRAEVAEWKRVAAAQAELHGEAESRADKLEEALREAATSPDQILLDAIEREIRQLEGKDGWLPQATRIANLRAAIDQARGKAGQEVGK